MNSSNFWLEPVRQMGGYSMSPNIQQFLRCVYPLVLLWVLLVGGPTQARTEVAASVHFASGYVAAQAPGAAERQLAKGDGVLRRDRIDTADNGRVQMRFTDGGLVSLMPNSTFTVDEYFHQGGADDDASLVFGLLKGGLRTVTGTIGQVHHDQYELKTPVATLGIRGTEYVAVLRPANTLRVHVGRGKVVISNDQGSLEVPEGRNAVVTLGSAPEFSDQGPRYQATGPMGDRLTAVYQHHQDPHLLDPRANMPPQTLASFNGISSASPDQAPSPAPGLSPSPSPGGSAGDDAVLPTGIYQLAITAPFSGPLSASNVDLDFNSSGHLSSLDPSVFNTADWQSFNVVTSGALSWGEFTSPSGVEGFAAGAPITLLPGQYAPYVVGSAPVTLPTSGQLNYSLDGATPARSFNNDGGLVGSGTLTSFGLLINLDTSQLDVNMKVVMVPNVEEYDGSVSGSFSAGFLPGFSIPGSEGSVTGGNCSSDCVLSVDGFLAGSDAGQAGVTYRISNSNPSDYVHIIGAAGLKRD